MSHLAHIWWYQVLGLMSAEKTITIMFGAKYALHAGGVGLSVCFQLSYAYNIIEKVCFNYSNLTSMLQHQDLSNC